MDVNQYKQKLDQIEQKYKQDKFQLAKQYVVEHNTVKKGDIVKRGDFSVCVDKIEIGYHQTIPESIYIGYVLTKCGTLRKDKERARIPQHWVTQIIRKEEL